MKKINVLIIFLLGFFFLWVIIALAPNHTSIAREDPGPRALAEPLPDLVLHEFTMTPTRPRVNEPVTLTIQVGNAGVGTGPGWRVNLYIDPSDQPPISTTVETNTVLKAVTMPPATVDTVEFANYTFTEPGCQHVVYAWADPRQGIPESDETNNMRVIHLCVDPDGSTSPGADVYEPDDACDVSVPSIATDGTPQVRSFTPLDDIDYVQFQVTQGGTYTITAAGTGQDAEPGLELSDSCDFTPPFGTVTRLGFAAPTGGTYYLKLYNTKENPDLTKSTYQLTIQTDTQPPPTGEQPIMFSISPTSGINDRNTNVIITGTQFVFPTMAELCLYQSGACTADCTQLLNSTWVGAQKLYATVPANLHPGAYCVQATNPSGRNGHLPNAFTVRPSQPDPRSVVPAQGYGDVPIDLHVYGFNFGEGISMTIGAAELTNIKIFNGTHVVATLPKGLPAGLYDLIASYPGETPGQLTNAFTVLAPQEDLYAYSDELWRDPVAPRANEQVRLGLVVHRRGGVNLITDLLVRFAVNGATIGDTIIPLLGPGGHQVNTDYVPFTPTVPGTFTVTAIIDPDETVPESTRANNIVTRTLDVLPPADDGMAPHVDSLTINGGGGQTVTSTQVTLDVTATDPPPGETGVAQIRYIELEYNQGAQLWVPVQDSHWLNYTLHRSNYAWTLTPVGGIHYIQAWAKDADGNISHFPYQESVTYLPPTEWVGRNQVRIYRQTLAQGETLHVTLTPLSGDADLYIWPPDWQSGRPPWVSNLSGDGVDTLTFAAPVDGVYQIEVYGYTLSEYQLDIAAGTMMAAWGLRSPRGMMDEKPWPLTPVVAGGPPNDSGPPILMSLTRATIDDQAAGTGMVNTAHTLTATASYPLTSTISLPITYTWQATEQSSETHPGILDLIDTVTFTWSISGTKSITVMVSNSESTVTGYYSVDVDDVGGKPFKIYLPLVLCDSS